jgi:hypothetical protein
VASRIAPLTGAAFVVLLIVSFAIAGEPPDADENARKIVEHFTDNKDSIMFGAALETLAAASLVFFGGYLRTVLRDRGQDSSFLPTVAMAGTLAVAIGGTIDATILFTMAETADDVDPGSLVTLNALWQNDFLPMAMGTFVFLLATGLSVVRGAGVLPKWMGWVMLLLAVTAVTPIGFAAFIGSALVILIVSILLAVRSGSASAA